MKLPHLKIRNIDVPHPIIQGGMGIGVSWERLAGNVAKNGCIGIISTVCTGYRHPSFVKMKGGRPVKPENLHNGPALTKIIHDAKLIAGGMGAIGVNILCAITDYARVVTDSVAAGAQLIISGAGLPLRLPEYVGSADVALLPIISSARALKLICKSWQRRYDRLPDAAVLEGPLSGGHQGFTMEQCDDPAYQLENLLPPVLEEAKVWGDIPIIVAGGIWDRADIDKYLAMGAAGVQMGTRFIGTFECDADAHFKQVILEAKKEDIQLIHSPVGYPARGVITQLQHDMASGTAPPIQCISNCVTPCDHGREAKEVGFCISDRLADAQKGKVETGLFFSGSNGYRLDRIVPVKELIAELTAET
ncbi:MAG: 2-nitropropane dioxygenase [Nitrospirae bacterium CG18_big_fil_WC_8_21_14_2_50_70_55]|nr:nitronate monooxygenase [Deltaproteobacteria bacterium]OIP65096.1 MAG: 2-nitropropane dioxygenase [Nitrospirae bacterium CG2_30_70_394]PIQ04233.1 MAG: 2-nitropropane dioxygenase [Nitrospirae bacterium CG18_big_fil_WC_8_21_14_2_50_70_55]PIU78755.1 MAG: 2-nitropropane dioxygenase [Nitrospirae bacterium CG06_land_8_20_14_3_00_70_43]PIW81901.1 MAG: 2-nitropropane dioxygenase [Nitrospirae bacterium CG_4_8_14_3_um_filter_70_85]PIX84419.1 MAG: 2-nitropropane dioxygenase [Nitrospirae bacterium CG_4